MKKLLLVLLVVALASFLLIGCMPTTPAEGEGEGEGEGEICPTVAVTSQVAIGGKTYIKGGSQTITVTFAVPTEPISVYVGGNLKIAIQNNNPEGVPDNAVEVVMYPAADKKIYTGTFNFLDGTQKESKNDIKRPLSCSEDYIYVLTCNSCAPCKYPYIVDTTGPASEIKISNGAACSCEGCTIEFDSTSASTTCDVTDECCGDDCSGFASYAIDLYTLKPFDECCDVPCATPAYSCPGGVACPIDCTLTCITGTTTTNKVYYAVATLLDNVGNKTRYYATLTLDSACGLTVQEFNQTYGGDPSLCSDYLNPKSDVQTVTTANPAEIGLCLNTPN